VVNILIRKDIRRQLYFGGAGHKPTAWSQAASIARVMNRWGVRAAVGMSAVLPPTKHAGQIRADRDGQAFGRDEAHVFLRVLVIAPLRPRNPRAIRSRFLRQIRPQPRLPKCFPVPSKYVFFSFHGAIVARRCPTVCPPKCDGVIDPIFVPL
jgi:hypothetical protein